MHNTEPKIIKSEGRYFFILLLACFVFLLPSRLIGQIKIVPLPQNAGKFVKEGRLIGHGRYSSTKATNDTLSLPFWEDFSTSWGVPDSNKWAEGHDVLVNGSFAINPPTLHVATFEGTRANGTGYGNEDAGFGDVLTSKNIDLSSLNPSDDAYLSFFWQQQGYGEDPEPNDYILLEFKATDSTWSEVWRASGDEMANSEDFTQAIIRVEEAFFLKNFQFRFRQNGRLNGPFDTWHIDYIYLDTARSLQDQYYEDRAFIQEPTSPLGSFSAVPLQHFLNSPKALTGIAATLYNLSNTATDVTITGAMRYVDSTTTIAPQTLSIPSQTATDYTVPSIDADFIQTDSSEIALTIELFITDSPDKIMDGGINYLSNDTIRATYHLSDFYAFDDGTAEYGYGIHQTRGRIGTRYILEEQDRLTHIDICFPTVGASSAGQQIEIFVLKHLGEPDEQELYTGLYTIQSTDSINRFQSIKLNRPVSVSDTIYIGFRQSVDEFIPIGLDRNTESAGNVFYNTTGIWQNDSTLQGNLMIRPRFSEVSLPTGIQAQHKKPLVRMYPNPGNGQIWIEGTFETVRVLDMIGRLRMIIKGTGYKTKTEVDLSSLEKGVYIFNIRAKGKQRAERVIVY